ncbi:MAG: sugar phosphate isomerase/epimerase [Acidobacteria bacterium]|nr:sugar phosphate isomerase/epimerase [Acidobacteriota bacterium]
MNRRQLIGTLASGVLAAAPVKRQPGTKIKIGLNAYSFNRPLMAGKMTVRDVITYCAKNNIDGVDMTGYYFPGYPKVPSDASIRELKRMAFQNGVTISGTGVRNEFALPDPAALKENIQLVKNWVDVAEKLGSDMVRVFAGKQVPEGHTFDEALKWMIPAFKECADYGASRGVMIGLQHHDDFIKTADETIRVVDLVNHDWFTVILDVGSLRAGDPYEEIQRLLPYSSNWQIKEHVWYGKKKVEIDLPRLRRIIDKVGYRGFTPIEALGEGDPESIVTAFLHKVRAAFS